MIARAYASRHSELCRALETPDGDIRLDTRPRATVTLGWNHVDDPARPFLELREIRALEWEP